MKLLYAHEMKEIDRKATSIYGIPSLILMENAGLQATEVVQEILGSVVGKNVVILAGKGNNGGDGFVVARHLLNAGANVDTFIMGNPGEFTPDSRTNFDILSRMTSSIYPLYQEEQLNKLMLGLLGTDLIVDAIYGIGFKGSLGELDAKIVRMINWTRVPVVAVDIPSGVEADTGKVNGEAIRATHTVTYALPKIGLVLEPGKDYVGTLSVADISIPRPLLEDPELKTNLIGEAMVRPFLRPRKPESHKGTYGHVLVVGGSQGMTGAAIMTAGTSLRSGAGLVTAALPESILPVAEGAMVEVMTRALPETGQATIALEALPTIENLMGTASVCAIGPGMSQYPEAHAIIRFVLERAGIPVVIDADGLNALASDIGILRNRQIPVVLTPHPGEMARLTGMSVEEIQANRIAVARSAALDWGVTVVLKGNKTVVANAHGEVYVNITGNPGMATAGSGDVLCGIIAGLVAQGLRPADAACVGVYLHGLSGDAAAHMKGERGIIAGDLINCLPAVMKQYDAGTQFIGVQDTIN